VTSPATLIHAASVVDVTSATHAHSLPTPKGVDLTGLLGDIKEDWRSGGRNSPSGVQGRSLGRGSVGQSPPVKLHIIFALKYNKQQLLLLLDKINLAAKYTFKNIFSLSTFQAQKYNKYVIHFL